VSKLAESPTDYLNYTSDAGNLHIGIQLRRNAKEQILNTLKASPGPEPAVQLLINVDKA
jgi:hypothetical protein